MPDPLISYPFTEEGLRNALVALGTTPNSVATNLSAMGFRGEVKEPLCCPVANYLRMSLKGATAACIGKDERDGLFAEAEDSQDSTRVDMPAIPRPVAEFVLQFDDRRFPDLIEEDPHGPS